MDAYFVGLPVPRDIVDVLEKAQGGLHAGEPERRENFHVWLTELGELSEPQLEKVREALARVAVGPFYIQVDGLGTIGGNAPTVLYAELDQPRGLKSLHRLVGREAREAGLSVAHARVDPHIPVARFGDMGQHDLKQIMSFLSRRASLSAGPFPVTDFNLYRHGSAEEPENDIVESYELRSY
ncbi:MAG: RNA 2',3'-cyclic phosphodiesterase [Pseudomonadota bacterium]